MKKSSKKYMKKRQGKKLVEEKLFSQHTDSNYLHLFITTPRRKTNQSIKMTKGENAASFSQWVDGVWVEGALNSGDTAFMLVATALVIFMTLPGLALFYSGMIRNKHSLACKILSFCSL
jgi:hypothetical protein